MYYITSDREKWTMKKQGARVVARRLYDVADFMLHSGGKLSDKRSKAEKLRRRAARVGACADELSCRVCPECNIRYITRVNLCRDRLCPVCAWRRGKALTARLRKIASYNIGARFLLLTLTVKNCEWSRLADTLRGLLAAWGKLSRRAKFARAVKGWARTMEITRGKDGKAHPHLHILLQVDPAYFDKSRGLWLDHDELVKLWRRCLGADYDPSVDIRAVPAGGVGKAILEVTKYLAKNTQVEGLEDAEFLAYADAVAGVRAWAAGGAMREADEEIREEELLHLEEEEREERDTCPLCGRKLVDMVEKWQNISGEYDVLPVWGSGIQIINNGVVNIYEKRQAPPTGARHAGPASGF